MLALPTEATVLPNVQGHAWYATSYVKSCLLCNSQLCTVFQKSDAKIQITITTAFLIRIKYPLSSFNYHLSRCMHCKFQQNPPHSFWATAVLKMKLKNSKFPIWKSHLSSSYTKTSVSLCSKWPPFHLHGHARSRTRDCRTARSMMFWSKQRHSSMRCCFKWSTSRILLW